MGNLSEISRGRWHGILPQLGISPKMLRNRHGPCPICGGKDRFRFDDREGKGTWICNRCGSGDGTELVKRVRKVEFREAAKMIEGVAGNAKERKPKPAYQATKSELNEMWQKSWPVRPDDPVGRYLGKRCGLTEFPGSIRHYQDGGPYNQVMLARVLDYSGKPITLHRTYIDGTVATSRRLMPGVLPDAPVQIVLAAAGRVLGIAEGIETAISASALFEVPVWAAISAPLLRRWRPPEGVEKVIVFGDNDESFTGQEAAYHLARQLSDSVAVEVKVPTLPGQDWNDVHREIMAKA